MKLTRKLLFSGLFALVLLSMFLSWFGCGKGVQEISGTIILFNPFTLIFFIVTFIGIWYPIGKYTPVIGMLGVCVMELFYFFTWYLETINPRFDLQTCFEMAYPEFYFGFGISVVFCITYLIFIKKDNKKSE